MPTLITPVWTDGIVVIAPTKLSAGGAGYARGTIDLRLKHDARVYCKIGRLQTTVLATAIDVYIRPILNNGAVATNTPFTHPTLPFATSQTATTVCPTVATTANVGDKTLIVSNGSSFVKGDVICISDSGGTTFTRTEFKTISKVSGTTLTLAEPLEYQHTGTGGQQDIVSRLADVFSPYYLAGGSVYEVIFDYQVSATGGDVVVMAHAQCHDSESSS